MEYCSHCMKPMDAKVEVCPSCGRSAHEEVPPHHLLPGTILNQKFVVGRALGEGGFGITYIGRDLMLDMVVAIKEYYPNGCVYRSNTISPDVNSSSTEDRKIQFRKGRERFLREARILAKFCGEPGIVDVRDFFQAHNTAYIIMEYLDGETLKSYIKREGRLSPDRAVALLMPVMQTMRQVHTMGLIHRDISPDNIMLVRNKVKLLDFGAARDITDSNKSLSVMLKPGYAPEEQYRTKGEQGPWTDVYALCATIYKCVTGITPEEAMQRMRQDELRPISTLGIGIKASMDAALMKGMAILKENRYQNIDELLQGMEKETPLDATQQVDDDGETLLILGKDERINTGESTGSRSCVRCGKTIRTGIKFCTICGARQDAPIRREEKLDTPIRREIKPEVPKNCIQCGKPLKPGAKFCVVCGAKQEVTISKLRWTGGERSAATGEHCRKCGKPLKPGARFCVGCGTSVDAGKTAWGFKSPDLLTDLPASCPKCGKQLQAGMNYCIICGIAVSGKK